MTKFRISTEDHGARSFSVMPKPNGRNAYGAYANDRLIPDSDPVRRWNKFRARKKVVTLPDKPFDWSGE